MTNTKCISTRGIQTCVSTEPVEGGDESLGTERSDARVFVNRDIPHTFLPYQTSGKTSPFTGEGLVRIFLWYRYGSALSLSRNIRCKSDGSCFSSAASEGRVRRDEVLTMPNGSGILLSTQNRGGSHFQRVPESAIVKEIDRLDRVGRLEFPPLNGDKEEWK